MSNELRIRDFLLHYMKIEYIKRIQILNNLVFHIERLYSEFLISENDRMNYLKKINMLLIQLNLYHNNKLQNISDNNLKNNKKQDNSIYEELENTFDIIPNTKELDESKESKTMKEINLNKKISDLIEIPLNSSIESIYDKIKDTIKLDKIYMSIFDDIDKSIFNSIMSIDIGCNNITDIISILSFNKNNILKLKLNQHETELMDVLNHVFIPLKIECKKKETKIQLRIIKNINNIQSYERLMNNFYRIELNIYNCKDVKNIHIYGYFKYDCIDTITRTSHIGNNYIYNKKDHFIKLINSIKLSKLLSKILTIPIDFKTLFIQNMSFGELMGYDNIIFMNELVSDYLFYQKYSISDLSFKNTLQTFIHADLITKYKIIKYLLLGKNDNMGSILFGITKESKNGSYIVADIIYKNLNLSLQSKLHNVNMSLKLELEKINLMENDEIDMKKQIMLNKNIPLKVKKLTLEKLNEMKSGGSEYYKQLMYVKAINDYPWIGENYTDFFSQHKNNTKKIKEIMMSIKSKLDDKVYGHIECKDTIVELLGKWFNNPSSCGKSIGLHGPPGVGKTMIAMELGKSLGIPFSKINLAGVDDNSILLGHNSTYSGANYGLIVKKMTETQSPRCIIFFDELDKTAYHHGRNEIFDVLIHVTDSTTNAQFNDKFFQDIEFPLDKVLFVFSFNDKSKINPILLDRMEVIKVDPYSVEDKLNIVNNYLLKEIKNDIGFTDITVKISDPNIVHIIESYTSEPGVRSIKRKLEKIFLKLNKDIIFETINFDKKNTKEIEITKNIIEKYLGKPESYEDKIHQNPEIGYVNGLYATDGGDGGLVAVIMYKNQCGKDNKFEFKITGNLQKIMADSISLAFSIASNIVKQDYIDNFLKKYPFGLHIHSGDLSTSKEGPSAGSCYTVAFISKILNLKVKNNIAMTGECTGAGEVGAIGGLTYKLHGALKAGVKLVFVPKNNEKDLNKIKLKYPSMFTNDFKVILVNHVKEILEYALISNDCDVDDYDDLIYKKTFNTENYLIE
jgi:endopeptidase La